MSSPPTTSTDDFDDDERDDVVTFDAWRAEQSDVIEAAEAAEPRRTLGRTLAGLRTGRGLTQRQLAQLLGKHQSAIARIENGTTNVGWETIHEILTTLRVTMLFSFAEADPQFVPRAILDAQQEAEFARGFSEGMVASASIQSSQVIRPSPHEAHRNAAQ